MRRRKRKPFVYFGDTHSVGKEECDAMKLKWKQFSDPDTVIPSFGLDPHPDTLLCRCVWCMYVCHSLTGCRTAQVIIHATTHGR